MLCVYFRRVLLHLQAVTLVCGLVVCGLSLPVLTCQADFWVANVAHYVLLQHAGINRDFCMQQQQGAPLHQHTVSALTHLDPLRQAHLAQQQQQQQQAATPVPPPTPASHASPPLAATPAGDIHAKSVSQVASLREQQQQPLQQLPVEGPQPAQAAQSQQGGALGSALLDAAAQGGPAAAAAAPTVTPTAEAAAPAAFAAPRMQPPALTVTVTGSGEQVNRSELADTTKGGECGSSLDARRLGLVCITSLLAVAAANVERRWTVGLCVLCGAL